MGMKFLRNFSKIATNKALEEKAFEWCCLIHGEYIIPCLTCPYTEKVRKLMMKEKRRNPELFGREFIVNDAKLKEAMSLFGLKDIDLRNIEKKKIRKIFNKLALKSHPDSRCEEADGENEIDFSRVYQAYKQLLSYLESSN
eukprot:snap_masked-scaffold_9-processed-gene-1.3-mRNA-1 protein AED:1.00 eAED:1.00 QI:0/-1/0/0/-1/1/1/0/140